MLFEFMSENTVRFFILLRQTLHLVNTRLRNFVVLSEIILREIFILPKM